MMVTAKPAVAITLIMIHSPIRWALSGSILIERIRILPATKAAASAIGRQLASLKKPWMPEHVRTAMENRLYRQRMTDHSPNWTGIRRPGDP